MRLQCPNPRRTKLGLAGRRGRQSRTLHATGGARRPSSASVSPADPGARASAGACGRTRRAVDASLIVPGSIAIGFLARLRAAGFELPAFSLVGAATRLSRENIVFQHGPDVLGAQNRMLRVAIDEFVTRNQAEVKRKCPR